MSDNAKYKHIFIAYASKDEAAYKTLMRQLEVLAKGVPIETWGKAELMPGSITQEATQAKLKSADILLLLVSADLLTSESYLNFQSQVQASTTVVPVLLRPCAWENDDFLKDRQALPKSEKFISLASDKDEVYTEIVREIKKMVVGKADDKPSIPPVNESPFWKKSVLISLVAVLILVGIWGISSLFNDEVEIPNGNDKSNESPVSTISLPDYGTPIFTTDTSLFKILIIRFEDDLNEEDDTYCIGRAIRKNLVKLETKKGLPITSVYEDDITSPDHPDKAKKLQEYHNADLLIYGIANKIQENCVGANMCFRHIVADTIMANIVVPENVNKENHNFDEPMFIAHADIEQGKLSVDEQSMEAWVTGLVALKKDDKETYFEEIEKMAVDIAHLPKEEQASRFFNQGDIYSDSENYEKAIASYTKAIELKPGDAIAYNNRGITYGKQKSHKKAIWDFNKAIELKSNYAEAYSNRGNVYYLLGERRKAILDYEKAIKLDTSYSFAYNNLGTIYSNEFSEYEKAILNFDKAIELNSNDANSYYNRGITYSKLKKYENVISDLSRAIKLKPNNAVAYSYRAFAHNILKEYEKAIFDYSEAIKLKPDYANAHNGRGAIYSNEFKEYEKAIVDFSKAIELEPKDAIAYFNRGVTYSKLKEHEKASLDFTKATELDHRFQKK